MVDECVEIGRNGFKRLVRPRNVTARRVWTSLSWRMSLPRNETSRRVWTSLSWRLSNGEHHAGTTADRTAYNGGRANTVILAQMATKE